MENDLLPFEIPKTFCEMSKFHFLKKQFSIFICQILLSKVITQSVGWNGGVGVIECCLCFGLRYVLLACSSFSFFVFFYSIHLLFFAFDASSIVTQKSRKVQYILRKKDYCLSIYVLFLKLHFILPPRFGILFLKTSNVTL